MANDPGYRRDPAFRQTARQFWRAHPAFAAAVQQYIRENEDALITRDLDADEVYPALEALAEAYQVGAAFTTVSLVYFLHWPASDAVEWELIRELF